MTLQEIPNMDKGIAIAVTEQTAHEKIIAFAESRFQFNFY